MVNSTAATAALLSTGFISLAPNVVLLFMSFDTAEMSPKTHLWLNLGQALAAGALLGDVFLHTLPHADPNDETTGIWILAGFTLFLCADLLIRNLSGEHHDHSHSHNNPTQQSPRSNENGTHHQKNNAPTQKTIKVSTVALNLMADALHNFTDGLAIGASFTSDASSSSSLVLSSSLTITSLSSLLASRGGLATLSILLHEIPHEVGDFCTLVQAGYSRRAAIGAQLGTAVAAFLGTIVALFVSDLCSGDQLQWITAGGFVYLAAVTILPEVLSDPATNTTVWHTLAQLVAFLSGIAFMRLVAFLEEHDHGHDHGHHHHHHKHSSVDHHDHHHHEHVHNHETTAHDMGEL